MLSAPVFEVTVDGNAIVGPVMTIEQLRAGLATGRVPQNAWVRPPETHQWFPQMRCSFMYKTGLTVRSSRKRCR